jgi:hypothetical protein
MANQVLLILLSDPSTPSSLSTAMDLDSLPQELIDQISSYLKRNDLKNTLSLSPKFQLAAEKYSGAFDEFELSKETAPQFVDTFGGRRFRYLQHLSFRTSLPPLDKAIDWNADVDNKVHSCRDTEEELREADECFTDQIRFLFSTVKTVEDHAIAKYGPGRIKLTIYTPTRHIDRDNYCLHRAYVSWRVHLLNPEIFPSLASVRALRIENGISFFYYNQIDVLSLRKIDLKVLVDLSAKLPNIRALRCSIGGDEWLDCNQDGQLRYTTKDWAGPRRDSRQNFAKALQAAPIPSLRDARLDFIAPFDGANAFDQRKAFPNLVAPQNYDIFSSTLRVLSCQLRRFSLTAIVDHTLFWPTHGAFPSWPNLEILNVTFHIMTPSGEWYFNGLRNEGSKNGYFIEKTSYPPYAETAQDRASHDDFDWDDLVGGQYRVVPNNTTLVPLLTAFATAAAYMPRLNQALLWAPLILSVHGMTEDDFYEGLNVAELTNHVHGDVCEPLAWGIVYTAPNSEGFMDCRGRRVEGTRQIWWQVAKWRPDKMVHQMFRSIGQEKHGDNLIEYWEDDRNGAGLADQNDFKRFEQQLFRDDYPTAKPLRNKYF